MTKTWEEAEFSELDAAVRKHLKRKPVAYDELVEKIDLDPVAIRESLYRMATEGEAYFNYDEQGWSLPPRRRKLTRREAIGVLAEAAESWSNELSEYIIPADDDPDSDDWEDNASTTANRREQMERIDEAIALLLPKKENQ